MCSVYGCFVVLSDEFFVTDVMQVFVLLDFFCINFFQSFVLFADEAHCPKNCFVVLFEICKISDEAFYKYDWDCVVCGSYEVNSSWKIFLMVSAGEFGVQSNTITEGFAVIMYSAISFSNLPLPLKPKLMTSLLNILCIKAR